MEFDEINNFISRNLPSIDACKIKIEKKNDTSLIVTAPLEYNKNDKGIAFGGSIYNIALMACWSTMFIECKKRLDNPNILTRDGQIRYRHPCSDENIQAICNIPTKRQWEGFFAHYEKTGKTSLSLSSKIISNNDIAVFFDGVFVLLDE